jgi:glycerol kinase
MQFIADLLDLEVRVAAAREATAMGIANLAAHSALGTSLEDLSKAWKAEAVYTPKMKKEERGKKLAQWDRALEAVKHYHKWSAG